MDYDMIETGCYVDGHWGWRGIVHLVNDQFSELTSVRERRLMDAYGRGWTVGNLPEVAYEIADQVESRLADKLPEGMSCGWFDGEFFVFVSDDPEFTDWH